MVCIPCIVIPFILWFFHKYIRPYILKIWPGSKEQKITDKKPDEFKKHLNGIGDQNYDCVPNGEIVKETTYKKTN